MAFEYRPIPRLTVGAYPLTNVTPFTYRDGMTYEKMLHVLIKKINDTVGEVNDSNKKLYDTVIVDLNNTIDSVNEALGEQTVEVDQKLVDLTTYVDVEVSRIVDMRDDMLVYRDETEEYRNQAETFSATTTVLQDGAVSQLIEDDNTETSATLNTRITLNTKVIHILPGLGQSNMSGRGVVTDTAVTDPTHPRILQMGSKTRTLRLATEPLDMHDSPSGIGPLFQIARHMIETLPDSDVVVLVPAARGGTPLVSDAVLGWKWGVPGNLTAQAIVQIEDAITAAHAEWPGATVVIDGIFWVQGENDGLDGVTANTYQAELEALIAGLRNHFSAPQLPFVMGQMLRAGMGVGTVEEVNWAQTRVALSIPRVGFALAPTEQNGDNLHYSATGQRKLGARMYAELVRTSSGLAPIVQTEPPAGLVLASDYFIRPDGLVGIAPDGKVWVGEALGGGVLIPARVISNEIGHTATTGAWSYWTLDTGNPNYTVETKVGSRNSSRLSQVVLKYIDTNNFIVLALSQGAVHNYQISGKSGGVNMTPLNSTVVQGDFDILRAVMDEDKLTVYAGTEGDTLVGEFTLPGILPTATKAGFSFHPTSANTWDYITITA